MKMILPDGRVYKTGQINCETSVMNELHSMETKIELVEEINEALTGTAIHFIWEDLSELYFFEKLVRDLKIKRISEVKQMFEGETNE